jgi:hypothetical protein
MSFFQHFSFSHYIEGSVKVYWSSDGLQQAGWTLFSKSVCCNRGIFDCWSQSSKILCHIKPWKQVQTLLNNPKTLIRGALIAGGVEVWMLVPCCSRCIRGSDWRSRQSCCTIQSVFFRHVSAFKLLHLCIQRPLRNFQSVLEKFVTKWDRKKFDKELNENLSRKYTHRVKNRTCTTLMANTNFAVPALGSYVGVES